MSTRRLLESRPAVRPRYDDHRGATWTAPPRNALHNSLKDSLQLLLAVATLKGCAVRDIHYAYVT